MHTYILAGQGSPTVVLESGLGDGKDSWVSVFSRLAAHTRVFAYDRAGYGSSRSGNSSRDGTTIVNELRSTLQAIGLEPPYILVGHSIGGTYMELYARSYPEEVAGVVLIDSRHADFDRQCREAGALSCTPPAVLKVLLPKAPKQELADGEMTMAQVTNAGPFPEVPLVVLTSGGNLLAGTRFNEVWLETQNALADLSADSTHTTCQHCGPVPFQFQYWPRILYHATVEVPAELLQRQQAWPICSCTPRIAAGCLNCYIASLPMLLKLI